MEDRSVQYPQRYQLKKVEGTDDIFDFVPAPGEITEEGTLINKSALLKDETAALFKDLPENPVPDDVFKILRKAALLGDNGFLILPNGESAGQILVEVGGYIGNGKSDYSNPTVIATKGKPIAAFVSNGSSSKTAYYSMGMFFKNTNVGSGRYGSVIHGSSNVMQAGCSFEENAVKISCSGSTGAQGQLNANGCTYNYAVICV